jgi:hypothetical protein
MKLLDQLARKLELEAFETAWEARRKAALKLPDVKRDDPDVKRDDALYAADTKKLRSLKAQTASKRKHLEVKKQLESEWNSLIKATLALDEENMSPEEREAKDAEIDRMRRVFSRVCPEASPEWRENAERESQFRYNPPTKR